MDENGDGAKRRYRRPRRCAFAPRIVVAHIERHQEQKWIDIAAGAKAVATMGGDIAGFIVAFECLAANRNTAAGRHDVTNVVGQIIRRPANIGFPRSGGLRCEALGALICRYPSVCGRVRPDFAGKGKANHDIIGTANFIANGTSPYPKRAS